MEEVAATIKQHENNLKQRLRVLERWNDNSSCPSLASIIFVFNN